MQVSAELTVELSVVPEESQDNVARESTAQFTRQGAGAPDASPPARAANEQERQTLALAAMTMKEKQRSDMATDEDRHNTSHNTTSSGCVRVAADQPALGARSTVPAPLASELCGQCSADVEMFQQQQCSVSPCVDSQKAALAAADVYQAVCAFATGSVGAAVLSEHAVHELFQRGLATADRAVVALLALTLRRTFAVHTGSTVHGSPHKQTHDATLVFLGTTLCKIARNVNAAAVNCPESMRLSPHNLITACQSGSVACRPCAYSSAGRALVAADAGRQDGCCADLLPYCTADPLQGFTQGTAAIAGHRS
jgi:hypothetical protein